MTKKTEWPISTRCAVAVVIIIAIPFWVIFGPFILIYNLIEAILQPYLLKKQTKEWNEMYQECLKRGIYIDYPPTRGPLIELLPLKWLIGEEDDEEIDFL